MEKSNIKKSVNQTNVVEKKKSKSAFIFLIGAIVVLVLLFVGLQIFNTYPEVSYSEIQEVTLAHKEELNLLKLELVEQYLMCVETKDIESWKTFSQEWISRIGISKPDEFALRLSNRSMELVNVANFISRDMFQLWTEYNVALESGTPIDPAKEKSLLDSIDTGQNFIDKMTIK